MTFGALAGLVLPPMADWPTETVRAARVPRVDYSASEAALIDEVNARLVRPGAILDGRPLRLNGLQCMALAAIAHARGAVLPIGVGGGKTFIALLAGTVLGVDHTLILTKPNVVAQTQRWIARAQDLFCVQGSMQCKSYPWVSAKANSRELEQLAANVGPGRLAIVCDEAHALGDLDAARTRRFGRAVQSGVPVVAMSGTLSHDSIQQFAHIAEWALGTRSFLPRNSDPNHEHHVLAWSACLDRRGRPTSHDWRTVAPLLDAFGESERPDGGKGLVSYARQAFQRRMRLAPGVVCSSESSIGTSLTITPIEIEVPARVKQLLAQVMDASVDPEGEILPDDLSRARVGTHLSLGYYQKWRWPLGPDGLAIVDEEWVRSRRGWAKVVRDELAERAGPDYDSEALVRAAIGTELEAGAMQWPHLALKRWEPQRKKPEPPSVPTWIDLYLVSDVIDRVMDFERRRQHVIVWYGSTALEPLFREAGLPVYGAGSKIPTEKRQSFAASWNVHKEGVDGLQRWCRTNLVLEPPGSGGIWEQMLGRTHRQGQEADEVEVYVYAHTEPFRRSLRSAIESARYIEESFGTRQKLAMATWTAPI
jgi:hypothetical protein